MKARKNGEYWQISWIAGGNSHQFLGIIFSRTPVSEITFVVETIGNEHPRIDQELLRDAVQHGLKQYWSSLVRTHHPVCGIRHSELRAILQIGLRSRKAMP